MRSLSGEDSLSVRTQQPFLLFPNVYYVQRSKKKTIIFCTADYHSQVNNFSISFPHETIFQYCYMRFPCIKLATTSGTVFRFPPLSSTDSFTNNAVYISFIGYFFFFPLLHSSKSFVHTVAMLGLGYFHNYTSRHKKAHVRAEMRNGEQPTVSAARNRGASKFDSVLQFFLQIFLLSSFGSVHHNCTVSYYTRGCS